MRAGFRLSSRGDSHARVRISLALSSLRKVMEYPNSTKALNPITRTHNGNEKLIESLFYSPFYRMYF